MVSKEYIISKTAPPKVLHAVLPKKNIADIIDAVPLSEAVFLIAPYGYGKTLSVLSWLRQRKLNAAWMTFGETDNDEMTFFVGITIAIMRLTGWDGNPDDILSDPGFIADKRTYLWRAITTAEESVSDRILVIDDFRFLRAPWLLASFKDIVSRLLRCWRVVIISRTTPPSVFCDMMLNGEIRIIKSQDLAFSPDEIEEFFVLNGRAISQEEVLAINEQTEGWPILLSIVLSVSRGGPVVYSDAVDKYVMDFFEAEIWRDLSEIEKDFFLKTSTQDTLTPASCAAVIDIDAAVYMLRWLSANGLFISRADQHETFRYHRVFQRFLLEKSRVSGINKIESNKKSLLMSVELDPPPQPIRQHNRSKKAEIWDDGVRQRLSVWRVDDRGVPQVV